MDDTESSLAGRVAIVSGASAGLGRRFATALVEAGMHVVVTGRRAEPLNDLVRAAPAGRMYAVPGDITGPEFPAELVAAAVAQFGRLDVLVNNAGINNVVPAEQETTEDFLAVMQVNVVALFACCREAFPHLKDGGSIINIASIMGQIGIGKIPQAGYCASKGAVVNLTHELAVQWARFGIRVNAIAPGLFPSDVTEEMIANDERSMDYYRRKIPMQRPGKIGEMDDLLRLLASDHSSYLTGQVIAVDGGWTAW